MQNHPAPRDIPAGKILIAEYGELNESNRAIVERIAHAHSAKVRGEVSLIWSSPGFEPAGSCARWTNGFWAVWFWIDGARHGSRYLCNDEGEAKARAHYAKLTSQS